MARAIKLSNELVEDATIHAKANHRSPPKQIEHWSRIGKIAEENPDLTLGFVMDLLIGIEESESKFTTEYEFG